MGKFNDYIVLVTGGGSGIGASTAKKFAREGGEVILTGRTKEKLKKVQSEIQEEGGKADIFQADVTVERDVHELAGFIEDKYVHLDILINNAGGSGMKGSLFSLSLDEWESVQRLNLNSVFLVAKEVLPLLKKDTDRPPHVRPSIVNVSSLSGHKPGNNIPHYSAAKAGVLNLTKTMAGECAPFGIRVNSVSPGFIDTPLTEKSLENEKFQKAVRRHTLLERTGRAEEIANVIAFAASEEASYMTGSDLLADGGWLAK
ncbi:SDR family NAD(P)-dependent oxidoreductase [Thalassorhabdus alkalitolerans]|uniref:SDR family NAD(P)-dependent oxidoreductase n=1 Tax=Thalassorhabdus alkalitolerans TaxID=2282697 RepID=A0ABW0YKX3_9BACI